MGVSQLQGSGVILTGFGVSSTEGKAQTPMFSIHARFGGLFCCPNTPLRVEPRQEQPFPPP